ncbi:phage portal protein [Pseudovibrio sp. Ad37]|uniref:phage portal protein n=1 Tax=Pseudovibrio sp. Ad37 TaxID=989422 RepID=UPI0007AE6CF7|nr:phage portal protein [Pseudovibrio sp. Ad37]KZL21953.1 Phage portal protein, lambda family [Pseudovibrio sp. Ad37]
MRTKPVQVSFTWSDRALALFSPTRAAKRYASRATLANLRRLYEGAQKGRLSDGWRSSNTAADSEITAAGGLLRERMRDLVRNNPLAAQAVQVLVNNMVGPGIRPRAATSNKARNKKIDKLWNEWAKACDAHGHTDFHGLLSLAVREMIEGGEVFALKRPQRSSKGKVPLQIELREADHLDTSRLSEAKDNSIRQGIEYDKAGRRTAYWMFPDHPGDTTSAFTRRLESIRIPADMVAHLFERQRVQSRGVPWGTPAMTALRDLGDWQLAEMVRKKTEACLVGVVLGEDGDGGASVAPTVEDADGNQIEQFSPGMIAYARGGKDIRFNTPGHSGGIAEWNRVQMHIIASGFRMPYALMTGDLSQANFSSNRAGLNEFRRMVDQVQWHIIIPMFCERIWAWFIEAAFTAGLTDTPDIPAEWAPPKFESVNPKQDAETDLIETRSGFTSLPQQIAKRGYDPREVVEEQAAFLKETDDLGLVLDSDPRKMSRAGLAQADLETGPKPEPSSSTAKDET